MRVAAIATVSLAAASCVAGDEWPGEPASPHSRNELVTLHSAQLAGNLLEASAEITVGVLLPAAYDTTDEPLPVVYFLPGYTASTTAADMDDVLGEALDATPMIVVTVTGVNELGGAWYTDSPATGNWEQAIVTEVVPYIDAHYRTIASREFRGIAGHSMGGYGAFTIAMRHADVFGSAYVMSPAIAAEGGVGGPELFGNAGRASAVARGLAELEGLEGRELLDAMARSGDEFTYSYGLAFAPIPEPPYFAYPYSVVDGEVVRDDAVWARWEAGFGGVAEEVAGARVALMSLEAVELDCGRNDGFRWIVDGCAAVDAALTEQGVEHEYVVHDGTHTSLFNERMTEGLLPFFEEVFGEALA